MAVSAEKLTTVVTPSHITVLDFLYFLAYLSEIGRVLATNSNM